MTDRALLTVGHGTLDRDAFVNLVESAQIALLVDVRSYPGESARSAHGSDCPREVAAGCGYRLPMGAAPRWPAPDVARLRQHRARACFLPRLCRLHDNAGVRRGTGSSSSSTRKNDAR